MIDKNQLETMESLPLEVVAVSDNSLCLHLGHYQFEVPLAVLPAGESIPKQLLLKIRKPDGSVFAPDLLEERHRRLQDMIN